MRNKFYRKTQRLKKVRPLSNAKKRELRSKVVVTKKVEDIKLEKDVEPVPTEIAIVDPTPEVTSTLDTLENTNKEIPQNEQVQTVKPKRTRKPKATTEPINDENNVTNTID